MGLKMFGLVLCLFLVSGQALAAYAPDSKTAANTAESASDKAPEPGAQAPEESGKYTCKYYSVKLPDGWRAIVPPEETLGNVNAIFATDTGNTVVTMVAGPSGGEDVKTIAAMFAEQFKAVKQPALKNGQYTFQFPIQNAMASAWVAAYDGVFMMSYIAGNTRQGMNFIRTGITSDSYPGLLPQ